MTTFALCAPLIVGLAGYVVDKAVWQAQRIALQDVAEAASLAAARTLATDPSRSPVTRVAAAQASAAKVVFVARPDLTPTITVAGDGRSVTVGLAERGMVSFAGIFGARPVDLAVVGQAIVDRNAETACRLDGPSERACPGPRPLANLTSPKPAVLMPFTRQDP